MPPRLSIVTPSFNQVPFLERALRSVLSQRQHVHEYFVLDGGSTDGSQEIIERYADQVDFWRSGPDGGQAEAIQSGFDRATGDIFYFLNSDDVLLPNVLKRVIEAFENQPSLDVVSGWALFIDEKTHVVDVRIGPVNSRRWMRYGYLRLHQPTCFFRRELYEKVGGMDQSLHCMLDTELWYRFARVTDRWGGIDDYLACHRLHEENKGATLLDRYLDERNRVKDTYREFARGRLRHNIGRVAYYFSQHLSGRSATLRADRKRMIGRHLDDFFAFDAEPPVASKIADAQTRREATPLRGA